MISDFSFAFRRLVKTPGFTITAVVTLALGLGLNTSMFSLMNWLVLQPLPFPDKDALVRIYRTTPQTQEAPHSGPDFRELAPATKDFVRLAAFRSWGYTFKPEDRPALNLVGLRVTGDFFSMLGLQPELGRLFRADEDVPGNHVAMLSHATWQAQFGGDPNVIGRVVRLDGESVTLIGVMPASFEALFIWGPADIFRPMAMNETEKSDPAAFDLSLVGRIVSGESLAQVNSRLAAEAARLAPLRNEANRSDSLQAIPLQSQMRNRNNVILSAMTLGLAGFVLTIACANLANLLLARAIARTHDYAVRAALGATRSKLLRPLLAESVLLALCGGALGVLVASWANEWMSGRLSATGYIHVTLPIEWHVVAFAAVISLGTGLAFGLAPAWFMSRVDVNHSLKSGGRLRTGDRTQTRFRQFLIAGQFALALMLLAGAGFFIRGVDRMLERAIGWDSNALTMTVFNLPANKYPTPADSYRFYTRLQERLGALPGVEHVAVAWTLPLYQYLTNRAFVVDGRPAPTPGHEPLISLNAVTPSYVPTIGARLISGRNFTEADGAGAPAVGLINETLAKVLFPGEDPIGKRLGTTNAAKRDWIEIVGVVSDQGFAVSFNAPITRSLLMVPLAQQTWNYVTVAIRSSSPEAVVPGFRNVMTELDPDLPLQQFGPVRQNIAKTMSGTHMISTMLGGFAVLGLFLAGIGLYGVIANFVAQRTAEIGVRVALGAQARDVLWLVIHSGLRLTLAGAVIGLIGAFGLSHLLGLLSPEISANPTLQKYDTPLILAVVVLLLLTVAALACWIPARRATKVDPMVALRAD